MAVSSGDSLRKIKASDWNALLEMLRTWKSPSSGESTLPNLPCLAATLRADTGVRRPAWGEVVSLSVPEYSFDTIIEPTLPLTETWSFGDDEKYLLNYSRPWYRLMVPETFNDRRTADLHQPFAVCVDPRTMRFALSGLAAVRVRFLSKWHRYVRRPMLLPGDDPVTKRPLLTGCLDSAGSGPGQIVGVFRPNDTLNQATVHDWFPWAFVTSATPQPVAWALIRW